MILFSFCIVLSRLLLLNSIGCNILSLEIYLLFVGATSENPSMNIIPWSRIKNEAFIFFIMNKVLHDIDCYPASCKLLQIYNITIHLSLNAYCCVLLYSPLFLSSLWYTASSKTSNLFCQDMPDEEEQTDENPESWEDAKKSPNLFSTNNLCTF